MSFKKTLLIILLVIFAVFTLMLTTSYAWYSFENARTSFETVTADELVDISYLSGEYIATNTAVPIKGSEVSKYAEVNSFILNSKNPDSDNELLATISLTDISIDKALQNANFKIDCYYQGVSKASISGNTVGTGGATSKELGKITLDDNIPNNFEIKVYLLDNGTDQSNLMNKSFRAKIKIDVISRKRINIVKEDYDIYVSNITIDGEESNSLPRSGLYSMTAICEKGSSLSWEPYSKTLSYAGGSAINDNCSLSFTKDTATKKLLNTVPVGSYVKYEGTGGKVGNKNVRCKKGGAASSSGSGETEAPNSCLGQNAREDLDNSGYTYGYCYSASDKYVTTGWRVGYIKDGKAMLVSAGSPECMARHYTNSDGEVISGNVIYINEANARAMKYCNKNYVDGDCTCIDSDKDGLCDSPSTDAWALGDTDFYHMTEAISGDGKRLTNCDGQHAKKECGYNNDLIDIGGNYWFAAQSSDSENNGVRWVTSGRYLSGTDVGSSSTDAYGSRFVISLKSSVYITGGEGTIDDPYTISY